MTRRKFEAMRASKEGYTDADLAETIVDENWRQAKPLARLMAIETVTGWLGEMARAATEETMRDGQGEIPGMVLYRVPEAKKRERKSVKAATLAQLRDYAVILAANANGALNELRTVQNMIIQAEEAGCGEDEEVWPHLSDTPRLPFGEPPPVGEGPVEDSVPWS